ncbi:hypothetical protein [Methylobacterium brachiatum]|uniref:hypothetical protein n=1 Tax=Methylobacterium brachiatum TaxID=269660 RepID=UPI000EFB628D|nr:hypothetical protein [Methylobacterium brachiatum]AYO83616.1 hypothetical protein EBB05_15965 [Methylobacterium brachiatum]
MTAGSKTIFVAEINATELTLRLAEIAIGLKRPPGRDAADCLADLRAEQPQLCATFDRMAEAAAQYVTDCISKGSRPS